MGDKVSIEDFWVKYLSSVKNVNVNLSNLCFNNMKRENFIFTETQLQILKNIQNLDDYHTKEVHDNIDKFIILEIKRDWSEEDMEKKLSELQLHKKNLAVIETEKKKIYPRLSISGIIRKRKLDKNSTAMGILIIGLILSIFLSLLQVVEWGTIQVALFVPIVLLFISQITLDYRILKGFYGNNEREAREIIEFIVNESSNIDFKDGGKLKKIISDDDLEEIKRTAAQTIPSFAGIRGAK